MSTTIQLAGISGSLRKDSWNTKLLHAVQALLPENVTMNIVSIADLPLYNGDNDLPAAAERPASVTTFRNALAAVQGLVIVSPEYNYSIPGGLKNAIDWASRGTDSPLLHKPVSLMGASPGLWGTIRMQLAFHPVFQTLQMRPVYKPEVLLSQADKKFNEQGQLADETAKGLIRKQLEQLVAMIENAT